MKPRSHLPSLRRRPNVARLASDRSATALRRAAEQFGRRAADAFPWRMRPDLYHTLVAETLLQHTPSARVVPVFHEVSEQWPTFSALAGAPRAKLTKLLRGLGLQRRRADALIGLARAVETARRSMLSFEYVALPGVGPYTSGITSAVVDELPAPFVDGGIARLFRRYFGLPAGARADADKSLWELSARIAAGRNVRLVAWGLVDLARTVCGSTPACGRCPVRSSCRFPKRT